MIGAVPARSCLLSLLAVLLCACTSVGHPGVDHAPTPPPDELQPMSAQKSTEIHVDLIKQMLDRGEYYAALAHIQDARNNGGPADTLNVLEAHARRHLGQKREAEALYKAELNGPYSAAAWHGLGLVYADADLNNALVCLRRAVEKAPTDVIYRNDLGYALMEAGRYSLAMTELSTAAELAPGEVKSRNNLIILMVLMNNDAAAEHMAHDWGTGKDSLDRLREEARSIRSRQANRVAG